MIEIISGIDLRHLGCNSEGEGAGADTGPVMDVPAL
jgi:hypothetical protein